MSTNLQRDRTRAAWFFLAPALLLLVAFFLLPTLAGLLLSLTDFDLYAIGDPGTARFVGLANYRHLLQDATFWKAVGNTLQFVLLGGPLSLPVSLGAALLLERQAGADARRVPHHLFRAGGDDAGLGGASSGATSTIRATGC